MGQPATTRTRVIGTGAALPEARLTNELLARCMTTTGDWILRRTGIEERRVSPDTLAMIEQLAAADDKVAFMDGVFENGMPGGISSTLTVTDLAMQAAEKALAAAGLAATDLDCIIESTTIPELAFPHPGCLLQGRLGLSSTPAICLQQGCAGFIYALAIADQMMRGGMYRRVLVVGAELVSSMFDYSDRGRESSILFADGAGAAVLSSEPGERGVLSSHLHSDGSRSSVLFGELFGSSTFPPVSMRKVRDGRARPRMEGRVVFAHAVRRFKEVVEECLTQNGISSADVDCFIFHQANLRIIEAVASAMNIPSNRVFNNISHYGNTGAASVPIAMHEAVSSGFICEGKLVLLSAFGTGFSWGAALLRW
jgi:3-oxoacyl-[acyl-carrier-protein] synthase-3